MPVFDLRDIRLVSWDLDGTCYSIPRLRRAMIGLLAKRVLYERPWRVWREWRDFRRLYQSLQEAVSRQGVQENPRTGVPPYDSDRERLEARWFEAGLRKAGARPHLVGVLASLRSRTMPQVIFSNFEARGKLRALGLESYFEATYCGEQVGFKPNPAGFQHIADDQGVRVSEILHIGDRPDHDAAAARAAGCGCLILGRDFADFSELLPAAPGARSRMSWQ